MNHLHLEAWEKPTLQQAEYFTCINWKSLGNKERFEFKTEEQATKKAESILKEDNKAKILIYAVKGTSQALINTFRGKGLT